MCETINDEPIKKGLISKLIKGQKVEPELTAESARYQSVHGQGTYFSPMERIAHKQSQIKNMIKACYPTTGNSEIPTPICFCFVHMEEDLLPYTDNVFQTFKDKGFKVVNVSDKCKEIEQKGIFYISWENAFKNVEKAEK